VRQHVSSVLQVGSDPLKHTWWQDAEKPWQALAACAEIAAALQVGPDCLTKVAESAALTRRCEGLAVTLQLTSWDHVTA
jgi:DNA-directed RNA polymerase